MISVVLATVRAKVSTQIAFSSERLSDSAYDTRQHTSNRHVTHLGAGCDGYRCNCHVQRHCTGAVYLAGAGLNPDHYRQTTFANALGFPVGMAELPDGSLLVAESFDGGYLQSKRGTLTRLADTNSDGIADVRTELVTDVPFGLVDNRARGRRLRLPHRTKSPAASL